MYVEVHDVAKILDILEQIAPRTSQANRPADAFNCALADYGCDGWTRPQFAILKAPDGTLVGLCPRREQHAQLARVNSEAATIVGRLAGLFRQVNPGYQIGSKAKTKTMKVPASV
jgi:hypothetical protein